MTNAIDLRLLGSNPGLALYEPDEPELPVAYASAWRVDWSVGGAGVVLITWYDGLARVISDVPELGTWLLWTFNQHFPEVSGLPWPEPEITVAQVRFECDLDVGVRVTGADVVVEIAQPLVRRLMQSAEFPLGQRTMSVTSVISPCRSGSIAVDGRFAPGEPKVSEDPISSTSFLANAEVWYERRDDCLLTR